MGPGNSYKFQITALAKLGHAYEILSRTVSRQLLRGVAGSARCDDTKTKRDLSQVPSILVALAVQAPLPGIKVEASWTKCEQLKSLTGEGY